MTSKKRLAAEVLKVGLDKVRIRTDALEDVSKAITRSDIRGLVAVGKIYAATPSLQSRGRARHIAEQKRKGRQKGHGTRKGAAYSRVTRKDRWMARIRTQRVFLRELREKVIITPKTYQALYRKCKGGYFRNRRHIKLYITERSLALQKKQETSEKQK
ncbi:50S ribosomal protein L19e [Candidatus Woesearchaeota archaeon]|nr:50S ribosomal protein L19e [Candidatus Woesearchaeota archaeon]